LADRIVRIHRRNDRFITVRAIDERHKDVVPESRVGWRSSWTRPRPDYTRRPFPR
jgi:hypothetical protein